MNLKSTVCCFVSGTWHAKCYGSLRTEVKSGLMYQSLTGLFVI